MSSASRDTSLDGLRGVAAFSVVLAHFAGAFLPRLEPGAFTAAVNGPYAVSIFFVLSGFVVGASARKRAYPTAVNLVARYARLAGPVLASLFFALLLYRLFPHGVAHLKARLPSEWITWSCDGTTPSVLKTVYGGSVGLFIWPTWWRSTPLLLNNPLWTMKIELIGSLAIYLVYGLTEGRARWLAMAAFSILAAAIGHFEYEGFLAGVLLLEGRARLTPTWGWPALVASLVIGSMGAEFAAAHQLVVLPSPFGLGQSLGAWQVVAATLLVYAVLVLAPVRRALSWAPVAFLGRVSFPLYLVHVPLLLTAFAGLYGVVPLPAIFAAYLVTVLIVAALAERWVDQPMLAMIGWAKTWGRQLLVPRRVQQA